jgi:nitrogen fixation/metabolism regulation signal transduction histidine kinase
MKRIRTKLVLSLLVITLLPVFPVYYLVRNLLERSLEIGFNKNVELALEEAAQISRELYEKYKSETLVFAEQLSTSDWVKNLMSNQSGTVPLIGEKAKLIGKGKIDFFDNKGNLIYSGSNVPDHVFPKLYQSTLVPLTRERDSKILKISENPGHIFAFAPILNKGNQRGFLVVTRAVDEKFTRRSMHVVKVHQMFKTLNLFQDDLTRGFLQVFFVIYAPIAVLSVAVGYYFSRRITSPLIELAKGTQKVSAGDWHYRMQVTSKDEVGQLVQAFNKMIGDLKEKQDQVIALEKMAVWREIARILAHEIKNPLTPIQLTVQQMKDKYQGDDPEYRRLLEECTEIISDEIESLRTLVREFSEFARMPKLNLAPGNLNELVEEVCKLYKDADIYLELDSSTQEINFDYEKLRRVLINLIENGLDSIKSKGAGDIQIKTNRQEKVFVLQVTDTGSGIPTDLQTKIFEPYFSTKKSGVGLGLAIVKRIVEEHGGKISMESTEGVGTTFSIQLPNPESPN